jgi:hypothetical protein
MFDIFINQREELKKPSCLRSLKNYFNKNDNNDENAQETTDDAEGRLPLVLIFHCEFSQKRGPRAMKYLREIDRQHNAHPNLFYPEIYLLEGGYESFHQKFPVN